MAKRPLFPNSLRYVREQRKLKERDVADVIGTSVDKIKAFEAGEKIPTIKQLAKFQEIYGVPDYLLANDARPNLEPLIVDYRKEQVAPLETSPRGLRAFFTKQALAELVTRLATQAQRRPSLEKPAVDRKSLLDVIPSIYKQTGFNPADFAAIDAGGAYNFLRIKFENYGIYTFSVDVPPEDYRGLYTRLSSGENLILLNKRQFSPKARLFTLVHEFAHFLIAAEGVSDPLVIKNDIERSCNSFASEFLLPRARLVSLRTELVVRDVQEKIQFLEANSLLSMAASAYRLRRENLITTDEYRRWRKSVRLRADVWIEPSEEEGPDQGNWAYNVIGDLGCRAIQVVNEALKAERIDRIDAARILNARGKTQETVFSTVEKRVAKAG